MRSIKKMAVCMAAIIMLAVLLHAPCAPAVYAAEKTSDICVGKADRSALDGDEDVIWLKLQTKHTGYYYLDIQLSGFIYEYGLCVRVQLYTDDKSEKLATARSDQAGVVKKLQGKKTYYLRISTTPESRKTAEQIPYCVCVSRAGAVKGIILHIDMEETLEIGTNKAIRVAGVEPEKVCPFTQAVSSDPSVVQISGDKKGTSWTIEAVGCGKTVITFRARYNKKVAVSYTVTVIPARTVIAVIGNYDRGQLTLFWDDVRGISTYEIFRCSTKKGTYKKIASVSASHLQYTDRLLKAGKRYYYKVRSLCQANGITYRSHLSPAVSRKAR